MINTHRERMGVSKYSLQGARPLRTGVGENESRGQSPLVFFKNRFKYDANDDLFLFYLFLFFPFFFFFFKWNRKKRN